MAIVPLLLLAWLSARGRVTDARNDLSAGFDGLDTANAGFVGCRPGVRSEQVPGSEP